MSEVPVSACCRVLGGVGVSYERGTPVQWAEMHRRSGRRRGETGPRRALGDNSSPCNNYKTKRDDSHHETVKDIKDNSQPLKQSVRIVSGAWK